MKMNGSNAGHAEGSLSGRVALITGGAHGIGRAIAEKFQGAGSQVCILDLDDEAGRATAAALTQANPELPVCYVHADLAITNDIKLAIERVKTQYGRLDLLVNNAGVEIDAPLAKLSEDIWDKVLAVNLRGPMLLVREAVPLFPQSGGSIINIASIHATHAFENSIAYACSKAGLVALTRNLALELAPRRIRVNVINPGYIDTRLWEEYLRSMPDAESLPERVAALHPLGRRGKPSDVAEAALFLAQDGSSFLTGTQIVVDGGLTIQAHV